MQKKHKNKGMILLAISDEPLSKVSPFVKKNSVNYIVGADAKSAFKAFGVSGYPTIFVIDATGTVAYRGYDFNQAARTLEKALKDKPADAEVSGLEEAAAKADYEKALKLYKAKDYAKAIKGFEQVTADFKGTDAARKAAAKIKSMKASRKIMAKIRAAEEKKQCEDWLDMARMLARDGQRDKAAEYYQKVINEYPDSSFADIAKTEMTAL
jgi:TolA-binding protein